MAKKNGKIDPDELGKVAARVEYEADRDFALSAMSEQDIRDFLTKHGHPVPERPVDVFATAHLTRVRLTHFPLDERKRSKVWLISHLYRAPVDDLVVTPDDLRRYTNA